MSNTMLLRAREDSLPWMMHGDDQMTDLDRRRFLGSAAATVAAGQLGLVAFPGG